MREAKSHGFTVELIYICLDTPEHNMLRVRARVLRGGHNVGDHDIHRRYHRSLANLPEAVRIADRTIIYDNSEGDWRKMLEVEGNSVAWRAVDQPDWIAKLEAALLY